MCVSQFRSRFARITEDGWRRSVGNHIRRKFIISWVIDCLILTGRYCGTPYIYVIREDGGSGEDLSMQMFHFRLRVTLTSFFLICGPTKATPRAPARRPPHPHHPWFGLSFWIPRLHLRLSLSASTGMSPASHWHVEGLLEPLSPQMSKPQGYRARANMAQPLAQLGTLVAGMFPQPWVCSFAGSLLKLGSPRRQV
jgi:hypothetical protein